MEEDAFIQDLMKPTATFVGDKHTRSTLAVFGVAFLLITVKIYYSLGIKNSELHDEVRFLDDWSISFEESTYAISESVIIADGTEEVLDFEIDLSDLPDDFRIGMVQVQISYTETSQNIADPCDSVQATLVQTEYPAQWLDENNNLNGGSNSCETINLELLTYPGYNGESYETEADNKVIALDPWKIDGYGVGTLTLEVSLDVQSSQIPTQNNDNDETVQIDVTVVGFITNVSMID